MLELNRQTMEDILLGCAVVGTGGGGRLDSGLALLDEMDRKGCTLELVPVDELADDDMVASPYFCGSISPPDPEAAKKYEGLPVREELAATLAFRALEDYMSCQFAGVLATELGGHNTASAMMVAAELGVPLLDADPAGRSVPELIHSTLCLAGVPITPFALASKFGDLMIVPQVVNDDRAEALARAAAVASDNVVGVADHPVRGRDLRPAVIKGTISWTGRIGRIVREARQAGEWPAGELVKKAAARLLFEGLAKVDAQWKDVAGFTEGTMEFEGTGQCAEREYRIWFKNENMLSWLDGEVHVTVPDLICVLEHKTGQPVINPLLKRGQRVDIIGFPATDMWRTDEALEIFGPQYVRNQGVTRAYVPLEEVAPTGC